MEGLQFATILCSIVGLFIWARAEAFLDRKRTLNIISEIQIEINDFHDRLTVYYDRLGKIEEDLGKIKDKHD